MRLFLNFLTRQKTKCILTTVIVSLMTGTLLQLRVFYSAPRRDDMFILKRDFAKGTIEQRRIYVQAGYRDDISDGEHLNDEKEVYEYYETAVSDNWTTSTSTPPTHVSTDKEYSMQMLSSDHRNDSKVVFFIGGHKCGSTTLATYLKHDPKNWTAWDANDQFMDGRKELCWSVSGTPKKFFWKFFTTHGSKTATFALDACPRAIRRTHFDCMLKAFPNASYLMLVRDPVDRVISDMNALLDKHKMRNVSIEDLLRERIFGYQRPGLMLPVRLSMFGNILKTAYSVFPRNKVMIVPNPDLKRQPQQLIDKVMRHIGAKPKNVTLVEANKRKDKTTYQMPSNTTIKWLRDMFYSDWELFKNISGIHVDTVYM